MLDLLLALTFPRKSCLKPEHSAKLNKVFTEKALEIYRAVQQNDFAYSLLLQWSLYKKKCFLLFM